MSQIKINTTIQSVTSFRDGFNLEEKDVPVVYTTEANIPAVEIHTTESITLTRETLDMMIEILDSVNSLNSKLGG